MAKKKNYTQSSQSKKNHKNGIKRPKTHRVRSTKGVDPKFIRNARHALHGSREAAKRHHKAAEEK